MKVETCRKSHITARAFLRFLNCGIRDASWLTHAGLAGKGGKDLTPSHSPNGEGSRAVASHIVPLRDNVRGGHDTSERI